MEETIPPVGAKPHSNSNLCEALATVPQHLYMLAGESLCGIKPMLQASGAIWSSDAWVQQANSWREHQLSVVDPASLNTGITRTRYDKAFCVEWINNRHLAVSTKCGHVLKVDRQTRTFKEVDLVGRRWVEPPIVNEDDLRRYRVDRGGIHCVHANSSKNLARMQRMQRR